jgi:hypothetical protein
MLLFDCRACSSVDTEIYCRNDISLRGESCNVLNKSLFFIVPLPTATNFCSACRCLGCDHYLGLFRIGRVFTVRRVRVCFVNMVLEHDMSTCDPYNQFRFPYFKVTSETGIVICFLLFVRTCLKLCEDYRRTFNMFGNVPD